MEDNSKITNNTAGPAGADSGRRTRCFVAAQTLRRGTRRCASMPHVHPSLVLYARGDCRSQALERGLALRLPRRPCHRTLEPIGIGLATPKSLKLTRSRSATGRAASARCRSGALRDRRRRRLGDARCRGSARAPAVASRAMAHSAGRVRGHMGPKKKTGRMLMSGWGGARRTAIGR